MLSRKIGISVLLFLLRPHHVSLTADPRKIVMEEAGVEDARNDTMDPEFKVL